MEHVTSLLTGLLILGIIILIPDALYGLYRYRRMDFKMKVVEGGIYQIKEPDENAIRFGFSRHNLIFPIGMKVKVLRLGRPHKYPIHQVLDVEGKLPSYGVSCYEGRLRPVTPEDPDAETDF